MKNYASMSGKLLPKTRELAQRDRERGKVGWAHWRKRKKQATHRLHRRVRDKTILALELQDMEEFEEETYNS